MIGTIIGDKYTIGRQLGEGGMGAVYEARHNGTGRRVAVKVITGALDPQLLARFELEARAAGAIESEHIAQVLDVGRDEALGAPFLVMELLTGEDLSQILERLGAVPADLALRVGVQACLGLERAHAQGIIHRDIKPANLFLTERDGGELRVKVLDFGIAKVTFGGAEPAATKKGPLTQLGSFVGSPFYTSPEQTRAAPLDHRTDIWSLGVVLYQALTGRTPFADAQSIGDFVARVCTTPVPPIRSLAPWVDPGVAAVVERALIIDVGLRFQSATEMRTAMEAFLPGGASIRANMLVSVGAAGGGPNLVPTVQATPAGGYGSMGAMTPSGSMPHVMTPVPAVLTPQPSAPQIVLGPPGTPRGSMPSAPQGLTQVGGPLWQPGAPATGTPPPVMGGVPVLGAAPPPGVPPPPPAARKGSSGALIAIAAIAVLGGGGLAAAFAAGIIGGKKPTEPTASASASASAPPPADSAATSQLLATLVGTWKSDSGVLYDAVQNGGVVEMRIREAEALASAGYVAGDVHFSLRPVQGEQNAFRVSARIRPLPPRGTVYDKTRARTTCEHTWREIDGKQLRAELEVDRLRVRIARVDPAPSVFTREGNRVVACAGLAESRVVEEELFLTVATAAPTPTPIPAPRPAPQPKPDAGAPKPDAGTPKPDAGAPPPVVDAGHPPPVADAGSGTGDQNTTGGRPVGSVCRRDGHCASNNCTNQRCVANTPGSHCVHNGHCASHQCVHGFCR